MSAIDFPNSPTVNQEFTANGRTWIWDGSVWNSKETASAVIAATAPILYNAGTKTVSLDQSLINQTTQVFANSTARAAAITSPVEGMVTYLSDTDTYQFWNGSAWTSLIPDVGQVLSFQTATNTTSVVAGTALTIFTSTVTIRPNRRYEFFGNLAFQPSATAGPAALFINSSGLGSKNLFYQATAISANLPRTFQGSSVHTAAAIGVTTGSGTAITFTLQFRAGANGALNTNPDAYIGANSSEQQFLIRDIGAV